MKEQRRLSYMCTKSITRYTLFGDVDILTPHKIKQKNYRHTQIHNHTQAHTDTLWKKVVATDVVQMTEESEETALLLVVPHLQDHVISKKKH